MNYDRLRPAIIMCVDCEGMGFIDGTKSETEKCAVCKGTGRVERVETDD